MLALVGECNQLHKFPAIDRACKVPESKKKLCSHTNKSDIFKHDTASEVKKKEKKETNNLSGSTKHPLLPDVRKTLQF